MPPSLELPQNFALIYGIYHTLACPLVLGMLPLFLLLDCNFSKGAYYILDSFKWDQMNGNNGTR